MKIALIGYGRMGQSIEKEAIIRGHKIILKISKTPTIQDIQNADIAIEFSQPQYAFENIKICLQNQLPVVCGTTGWLDKINDVHKICKKNNTAFLYSSNFSIGMNIFFKINQKLANIMNKYFDYEINIEEIHHTKKLDIPSGTSISLAQDIIQETNKIDWTIQKIQNKEKIYIKSQRVDNISGIHIVNYESNIDKIQIKHEAYNRRGFAIGAILAGEWLYNKIGIFSMQDVLKIE